MEKRLYNKLCEIELQLRISQKDALNINECAQFLQCSTDRLRHLASAREIPYYKRQGKLYFSKSEIDNWRLTDRIPTNDELSEIAKNIY